LVAHGPLLFHNTLDDFYLKTWTIILMLVEERFIPYLGQKLNESENA